jgi:hypothetical protein
VFLISVAASVDTLWVVALHRRFKNMFHHLKSAAAGLSALATEGALSVFLFLHIALPATALALGADMSQSFIQIDTSATPAIFHYPDPVVLRVRLYGPQPITNANLSADVKAPSGEVQTLVFQETGGNSPNDVLYSVAVPSFHENGAYRVVVMADDNSGRAAFAAGLESEPRPGKITPNTPVAVPAFSVKHLFSFTAHGYESNQDLRPLKITDLFAEPAQKDCYRLSWAVPLGLQAGSRYEVRASRTGIDSEKVWLEAKVLAADQYSKKGGEKQIVIVCLSDKGRFYLGVRSWSEEGLASIISNDYIVETNNN